MPFSPKVKIFVCHHKESAYVKNDCIVPIQVGRSLSQNRLEYCVGDDTGQNISHKNKSWCELTAVYWAWKNEEADYYGLMHYRRYLSFSSYHDYNVIHSLDEKVISEHHLSARDITELCKDNDIITGPVWNVHPVGLPWKIMSNYDQYALDHHIKDLDTVVDIVREKYPQFYLPLLESLHSTSCFFANVAVMKKEYYFEYCEFLFGVLSEAEARTDISQYDSYQSRIWGFLAERLINAYVLYARRAYKNLRVRTAGLLYLAEKKSCNPAELMTKVFSKKNEVKETSEDIINICMSFDDKYYPHASATIDSVIDTANSEQRIDFYILCDDNLTADKRNLLTNYLKPNIRLLFVEIDPDLFVSLPLNRSYISLNTYYRLIIHKVLPDIDKIIYLDSDMVCCDNILKLWQSPLNGNCIGASLDEGGILQSRRLLLGPENNYFNAGMIVFDLAAIRSKYPDVFHNYMENFYIKNREITLQDQDILNLTFKDEAQILPLKWNVNSRMFSFNELEHKYSLQQEEDAINDIGIIHYTDRKKPWTITCTHPLKEMYWHYRNKNPHAALTWQDKLVKKLAGKVSYKISGGFVFFKIGNYNLKLRKGIIVRVVRLFRIKF
ncbi:hypothetical protein EJP617_32920 [Erwinia sp. Ejp617]|nr:DUF4422 domain-containing protein [Erwinia sp. Ejp617]ADP12973.1 hypothetical protein EJP617_32920 [Erwinia sp. Ejp617]